MSLNRKHYKRTVYTFFDFLSEIGGLFNTFRLLSFVLVAIFQYQGPY